MAEVTIKLDSPIITTDKSISEITTDGLANTGEIALASDGIVGNVNGTLRKYPNPIKTFYVEKFVTNGVAKWGFEPKDVKTNDVVIIKTATGNQMLFTVTEATNTKATLCAFTKNGGIRIVEGQKLGNAFISFSHERVADYYSGKRYEYSLSEDLSLTSVTPFTEIDNAIQCVPSYYIAVKNGKNYLKLNYGNDSLLPIGASYDGVYGCVFYFIINHKGQQKLVVFQVNKRLSDDQIITNLSFVDLGFSPFNITIGKTTKQINGTADVSFSTEEITDKFNGALIQNLTTASTEADIRKAFTEVNTKTVLFPTPGSIITKLNGNNKGIVVSLSEPDATTLGRTITVYHGNDTYTIIVKSDFTKVLMPWSKVSSKRNIYSGDIVSLTSNLSEADIKGLLTPVAYQKYDIIYPIKPQTGDLMEEVTDDDKSRFIPITALRNQENPDEYTDILIPKTGRDNVYTKIVLKNDLTSVQSSDTVLFENYRRYYEGEQLLALDTVKAETIENSISDAYTIFIKEYGQTTTAQLPKVGDLIRMVDETEGYVPVCEVLVESDDVQYTRWFYKGKLYEVAVNTALTHVPEDPKVIVNSKKIYDDKLLSLGDTTNVDQIKKAFTPKGYAQPMIPDNGDIVQMPDGGFLIFNGVQEVEFFYVYMYSPASANTVISIQCRKDFTTAKTVIGVTRMVAYCYDGNALLDTEITTPSDIELMYTPIDAAYGYKSFYGAEPPRIGDIIIMPTKTSENVARGVVVDAVETNNTYITRWFYGGKLYEAEVTKDFTSIPKYGKVIYDTTSGTLRDLYISAGAKYNEETGYYELNGITDIDEKEMREIYSKYLIDIGTNMEASGWLSMSNRTIRTNLPSLTRAGIFSSLSNSISIGNYIEVLNIGTGNSNSECYVGRTAAVAHGLFPKLREVIGIWRYNDPNPNKFDFSYGQPFGKCPLLEEIKISRINKSHTFAESPRLSKASVLYMIANANPPSGAAVGSITITLHPTAYARLKDDADIVAALEAKRGIVTLVSA